MSRSRVDIIMLAIITISVASLCTFGIVAYLNRGRHWVQVVSPTQERAVEILGVNRLLRVYVKTDQGNVLLCGGRSWRDVCEPVDSLHMPATAIPGRWQTCTGAFPATPPMQGAAVDSLEVGQCQEARTYGKIVLLQDGTLWQWQKTFSWVYGFALASGVLLSLGLGLLLGLAFVRVRNYVREPLPAESLRRPAKPV